MANQELTTKEKMRRFWEEANMDIDIECTCNDCWGQGYCKYAYDLYNCSGDCLRDK